MTTEQHLSADQAEELIRRWEKKHKGQDKAYKIAALGKGITYQQIGLSPQDMQYLAMKKWNRQTKQNNRSTRSNTIH